MIRIVICSHCEEEFFNDINLIGDKWYCDECLIEIGDFYEEVKH